MSTNHFADRLTALRQAAGLSQYELARRTGLSRETLSKLEKGDREPGWETVQLLVKVLGVSCTDFVDPSIVPPEVEDPRPRGRPAKVPSIDQDAAKVEKPADEPARTKKPSKGKQSKRKGG
jgi:transcriptional regulator with XRE-family HTH domain